MQSAEEHVVGEDAKSIAKHVASVKEESKNKESNHQILWDGMKRTAVYCQKYYHEHTTAEVLQEFPVLRKRVYVSVLITQLFHLIFAIGCLIQIRLIRSSLSNIHKHF